MTGIELTSARVSRLAGMQDRVRVVDGDVTAAPLPDSFTGRIAHQPMSAEAAALMRRGMAVAGLERSESWSKLIAAAGFAIENEEDRTAGWAPILKARLAIFRAMRDEAAPAGTLTGDSVLHESHVRVVGLVAAAPADNAVPGEAGEIVVPGGEDEAVGSGEDESGEAVVIVDEQPLELPCVPVHVGDVKFDLAVDQDAEPRHGSIAIVARKPEIAKKLFPPVSGLEHDSGPRSLRLSALVIREEGRVDDRRRIHSRNRLGLLLLLLRQKI